MRHFSHAALTIVIALSNISAVRAAWPPSDIPANHGLPLGSGYDSMLNDRRSTCVIVTPRTSPANTSSYTITADLERSAEDIQSALGLEGAASFGIGLTHGSLSVAYLRGSNVSQYTETLLARSSVTLPVATGNAAFIDADTADLFKTNRAAFRKRCGDTFISGMVSGGLFEVAFTGSSNASDDFTALKAALDGGSAFWSANADVRKAVNTAIASGRISISITARGPTGGPPINASPSDLMDYVFKFPATINVSNAFPITYELSTYDYLAPFAEPTSMSAFDKIMQILSRRYVQEVSLANSYDYIERHRLEFDPDVDVRALARDRAAAKLRAEVLDKAAQLCVDEPTACRLPRQIDFTVSAAELPEPIHFTTLPLSGDVQMIFRTSPSETKYVVLRGGFYRAANPAAAPGSEPPPQNHPAGDTEGTRLYCNDGISPPKPGDVQVTSAGTIRVGPGKTLWAWMWGGFSQWGSRQDSADPSRLGIYDRLYSSNEGPPSTSC